jgi:hypothetical protein
MLNEHASLKDSAYQLHWASGALWASLELAAAEGALYPLLLTLSIAAMAFYQWSADESLITLLIMSFLGLVLGLLQPGRFMVSGVAIGAVVAAVNCFETLSGIRPAYEVLAHSLAHNLRWLVLVLPGLCSSAAGRQISRRFLS